MPSCRINWNRSVPENSRSPGRPGDDVGVGNVDGSLRRTTFNHACFAVTAGTTIRLLTAKCRSDDGWTTGPRGLALVLVVPELRFPELDLVAVWIHDPRERAVLVKLGPLHDLHVVAAQLLEHPGHVIDAIVDHEARLARAEPLAIGRSEMPHGEAFVLRVIVGPPQDRTAEIFERDAEILLIPSSEQLRIALRPEKHSADSGDLCHAARYHS